MGRGRHTFVLADLGYRTFGIDNNLGAIQSAVRDAVARNLSLRVWCADLTQYPLPRNRYELVVVTRYLQRRRMAAFAEALAPGGFLLYETFTVSQRLLGVGPTSPDHLLDAGELATSFGQLQQIFYEEVSNPEAVARLVARKTSRS